MRWRVGGVLLGLLCFETAGCTLLVGPGQAIDDAGLSAEPCLPEENLFGADGSFEEGSGSWMLRNAEPHRVSIAHSGVRALELCYDQYNPEYSYFDLRREVYFDESSSPPEGTVFRLSLFAKSSEMDVEFMLKIQEEPADYKSSRYRLVTQDWTHLTVEHTIVEANSDHIETAFRSPGLGAVETLCIVVDDICLTQQSL